VETVATPPFKLLYNNRNITNDVSAALISMVYHDKEEGASDDLQLTLEDVDALWKNGWYPEKGAVLEAFIGQKSTGLVSCGKFTIDENEHSGPPSVITIRAINAYITQKLKTARSKSHENKTLKEIVNHYAQEHNLTVVGEIADIQIDHKAQHRKSDMQFLHSLSATYGYVFNVKGTQLVFTKLSAMDSRAASFTLDVTQLTSYAVKDKSDNTFSAAKIDYHNPVDNDVLKSEFTKNADGIEFPAAIQPLVKKVTENVKQLHEKVTSQLQADLVTSSALYKANRETITGRFTIKGNPLAVAGVNFKLTGLNKLNGLYHIVESTHRVDRRSGYVTEMNCVKVGAGPNSGPPKEQKAVNVPFLGKASNT
jgi:phage protein D